MVKIRLTRIGRKNTPLYRVVVTPLREKRDSKAIEYVGFYDPMNKVIEFEKERIEYWMSVGAQPSETVKRLLIKEKLLKEDKFKKTYSKKAGRKAVERADAKAEKEAAAKAEKEAAKAAAEAPKEEEATAE